MSKVITLGVAVLLVLVALLDVVSVSGTAGGGWLALSFALASVNVSAVLGRRRLPRARLMHVGLALAAASLGLTVVIRTTAAGADAPYGLLETTAMALLLGVLTRRWARPRDTATVLALAAALILAPWRLSDDDAAVFSLLATLVVAAVVAVGLLRRADDLRAAQALLRVRNDERRDIARDLHDEVAHHVTGIIVAAQAAALAVDTQPEFVRQALVSIERTGIDALESMRYLVSVLRAPDRQQEAATRQAARWPDDLQQLVQRLADTTGLATTLTLPSGHVPAAHRQAVLRVAQEALTNVRRHAAGATRADVVVTQDRGTLRVSVTDDGNPAPGAGTGARAGTRAAPGTDTGAGTVLVGASGGFGLVGLRERAAAFGGSVSTGHREPHGWQVEVTLPPPRPGANTR